MHLPLWIRCFFHLGSCVFEHLISVMLQQRQLSSWKSIIFDHIFVANHNRNFFMHRFICPALETIDNDVTPSVTAHLCVLPRLPWIIVLRILMADDDSQSENIATDFGRERGSERGDDITRNLQDGSGEKVSRPSGFSGRRCQLRHLLSG